tara:strand:+ start:2700 stop:3944 length:1245 start_codon:yes stop_codon:yes gene_type:complete
MNSTEIIFTIFFIIIGYLALELVIRSLVLSTRREFQWLITEYDELPKLSEEGLKKFLIHGYDSELGWVRKPNTKHEENGEQGITHWTINEKGARTNPGFEDKISKISCYGDSFTFSRQVNNNETWEQQFSKKINSNVQNFGVGNYGIDQALLRLKREFMKNKTDIVIMGVVPDTISRILSIWKHYSEYGNTFGFKPRFIIEHDSLVLIKNPIDSENKISDYVKYLDVIREFDYFYEKKFMRDIIKSPYAISIFRNLRRNLGIIYWIKKIKKLKSDQINIDDIKWQAMKYVMRQNLKWRVKLFQDDYTKRLLKMIVEDYVSFSKEQNFKPIFIFLPQKDDLIFMKNNFNFYEEFYKEIKLIEGLNVIDVTRELLNEKDLDDMYSDNNTYGGHYSKSGNEKIADILYERMKKLDII